MPLNFTARKKFPQKSLVKQMMFGETNEHAFICLSPKMLRIFLINICSFKVGFFLIFDFPVHNLAFFIDFK